MSAPRNSRFAEACPESPLDLNEAEGKVYGRSLDDTHPPTCEKDIYIGVFFDGTNNNKFRDTPGKSHSNVARLYEAFPGYVARQTMPTLRQRALEDGPREERQIESDQDFLEKLDAADQPYYRKIYVPGVGTPHPDVGDDGQGTKKTGGLAFALLGQARMDWATVQLINQAHAVLTKLVAPAIGLEILARLKRGDRLKMSTKKRSTLDGRRVRISVAVLATALLASGCGQSNTENATGVSTAAVASAAGLPNKAKPLPTAAEKFTAAVDSVNYSHIYEFSYTLYDLSRNPPQAIGGDLTDVLQGGGSKGCCVSLPTQWHPGIKLKLDWERADFTKIEKFSQEFELPKYDRPGDVFVILNPDSTIEVIVSAVEPGHPDWPGKIKLPPWDQCVKDHGRKTCKQALPKYGGMSPDEMQGLCTKFKNENEDQKYCNLALKLCMRDYEDNEFCNKTLWGKPKDSK